jgi:hypothetical protein
MTRPRRTGERSQLRLGGHRDNPKDGQKKVPFHGDDPTIRKRGATGGRARIVSRFGPEPGNDQPDGLNRKAGETGKKRQIALPDLPGLPVPVLWATPS